MSAASLGAGHVGARPVRGLAQVEARVGVRQAGRKPARGDREVELGGAPLEVVAPLRLRVEAVGDHRQQLPRRGVGEVEDVLGRGQAAVGEGGVAGLEDDEALGQRGGVAAGQVGADQRARRPGPEHRPVSDVAVDGVAAAEGVVGLRQPPDVVVAERLCVAAADADLVVERAGRVVPHAQQEVGPEPRLGGEVGAACRCPSGPGSRARRKQHAGRVDSVCTNLR